LEDAGHSTIRRAVSEHATVRLFASDGPLPGNSAMDQQRAETL